MESLTEVKQGRAGGLKNAKISKYKLGAILQTAKTPPMRPMGQLVLLSITSPCMFTWYPAALCQHNRFAPDTAFWIPLDHLSPGEGHDDLGMCGPLQTVIAVNTPQTTPGFMPPGNKSGQSIHPEGR
jgi:hypothetical protein